VALSEPAKDEPSLRRLAETGVVGDQQPGPHRARDTHERHELVGLDRDSTPVKADELFTTARHRGEQCLVQCSPPTAVACLNIQRRQRENVGLESVLLELEKGLSDLILVDRIDADERQKPGLFFGEHLPGSPAPADPLARFEELTRFEFHLLPGETDLRHESERTWSFKSMTSACDLMLPVLRA
jgi:hypothetical protein